MFKRYFHSKHPSQANIETISLHIDAFAKFHSTLCQLNILQLKKQASFYPEVKNLLSIIKILKEEDKQAGNSRTLCPCLEYLLASKAFDTITASALVNNIPILQDLIIKIYLKLLKHINNQDIIPQMAFHSAFSTFLQTISPEIQNPSSALKLVSVLLHRIHKDSALLDLFTYTYKDQIKFLPLKILVLLIESSKLSFDDISAFMYIVKITDEPILKVIISNHGFFRIIIDSLSLSYQDEDRIMLRKLARLIERMAKSSLSSLVKKEISEGFFERFCIVLLPRLKIQELNLRLKSSDLLSVVVSEIHFEGILTALTYFLCDQTIAGRQLLPPLQIWEQLVTNLNHKSDQLSISTLKFLYFLLLNGGKPVIKLLITDRFSGSLPPCYFSITADIFLSLVPPKVLGFNPQSSISNYLYSAKQRCSRLLFPFTPNPSDPEKSETSIKLAETGGTEVERSPKSYNFFEGEILHTVLIKFKNFLSNSTEENLYLTGILSTLAAVPKDDKEFGVLHRFLLEPHGGNRNNFLGHFKELAADIDLVLDKDTRLQRFKKASKRLGVGIKSIEKIKKPYGLEKDLIKFEAIVVFQEFIKELSAVLILKETIHDISLAASEDTEFLSSTL